MQNASNLVKKQLKASLILASLFLATWALAMTVCVVLDWPVDVNLLVVLAPLLLVPAVFELVARMQIPLVLQTHYYVFITLSSVMGSAFGTYGFVPHWDSFVHAYSGALLVWAAFFTIRLAERKTKPYITRWFAISFAVMTPLAFAALWEISEFFSDMLFHTTTQAGLEDTVTDMAFALLGSILAIALTLWLKIPKSLLPKSLLK